MIQRHTHNGKTLEFDTSNWKEICFEFENEKGEGWFFSEFFDTNPPRKYWQFVRDFSSMIAINQNNPQESGIWTGPLRTLWEVWPNLTKEEAERWLKLETFK